MEFKEIYDTMLKPTRGLGKAWTRGNESARFRGSDSGRAGKERGASIASHAARAFDLAFQSLGQPRLITYREPILDMQLVQERIAGAAMELFASACVLSRWDAELQGRPATDVILSGTNGQPTCSCDIVPENARIPSWLTITITRFCWPRQIGSGERGSRPLKRPLIQV